MRGHLVDHYQKGTASTVSDFIQSAVHAATPILNALADIGKTALSEGAKGAEYLATSSPFSIASDVVQNTVNLPVQGATRLAGAAYEKMGGELSPEAAKILTQGIPELGKDQGMLAVRQALNKTTEYQPKTPEGEVTKAALNIAPYLAGGEASLPSKVIGSLTSGAGTVAGKDIAAQMGFGERGQRVGSVIGGAPGLVAGAGGIWDNHPGAEIPKDIVAAKTGQEPSAVSSQNIDDYFHEQYKDVRPWDKDFHNTATVMDVNPDSLYDIYKQTGVKPDQVYADAQRDPAVMVAMKEGQIPPIYEHLIDKRPPIPPEVQEAIDRGKEWNQPTEEPLSTSKEYSQKLYDQLHEKLGQDTATDIESMQRELAAKSALGKDLDEKFYLKKEDENFKLNDEEQKLYDQYVKPLGEQERTLYEKARALGAEDVEPVSESYVHRIVKGKGHYLDKYDTEFGADENIGFGKPRGISQTTSSLEEAQFHALQDEEGNRKLQMGEIPKGYKAGDKYVDETDKEWTIKRAKTSEIEANTELRYYKSAIGNTEDNIRRLDKTIRNIEFLNGLKGDMQKTGLGIPPSEGSHPQNYQQVSVPQLRGWSFDPRIAEVLNDIYDRGGDTMLGRINNILIKGMFLNPIPHVENVFYDYIASRGWQNIRAIKGANYIAQGLKDVKEFSPEYLDVLKRGGALRLPAVWKTEFYNQMERQFLKEMQQSTQGLDLAKSWGFDSVPSMAESVFNASQKALWGSGDAFLMAKIRELKDGGMSTNEAIRKAQEHIIDYRIPPRVGEQILGPQLSRMLSKSLQNNSVVVFTRYHFGLFKALGNSVKDLVTGTVGGDVGKASIAAGQVFATYLLLTVVNPAIAKMWSSITGQKEKMRNPGVTGLMGAVLDFATGKKSLGEALKSQFIVSPGIQVGSDILNDKIVNSKLGHEGIQLMDYLMKQPTMSVPAIPYNIREGKQSASEEALRQVGVTPDKEYKKKKPSRRSIEKLEEEERSLLGE